LTIRFHRNALLNGEVPLKNVSEQRAKTGTLKGEQVFQTCFF